MDGQRCARCADLPRMARGVDPMDTEKTAAIICGTLRRETELILAESSLSLPVFYMESGLHEQPRLLRARLQEMLDSLDGYERVLLSFGQCGNALVGVIPRAALIFPRVEDCISLLIGSPRARQSLCAACPTYFLTQGWLDGKRNLLAEYDYTLNKYGPARGAELFSEMLRGYRRIGVLDTGASDPDAVLVQAAPLCQRLGMKAEIIPASTAYLRQLLTGPWPEERFTLLPPGRPVTEEDLLLPGN